MRFGLVWLASLFLPGSVRLIYDLPIDNMAVAAGSIFTPSYIRFQVRPGVNNGIRTCVLVRLKIGQVRHVKPGSEIRYRESKTGKMNVVMFNKAVHKSLVRYLATRDFADEDYLFRSRKGGWHLSTTTVNNLVKKWTSAINLPGRYGAHTLRKTFGYIQRTKFGVGFDVLCKRFNHSNPAVRY